MKKTLFLFLAIILMFSSLPVLADETTVTAKDLNVSEPTVLPTSPFYFLKELGRQVQLLITLDPSKKADLKLNISSEKLVEAEKVATNKEDLATALNSYIDSLNSLKDYAATLKQDSESSNSLLKRITVQTFNQQKILDQIAEKQTDSSQDIFNSKDKALNSLTAISLSLGSSEKVAEALDEATNSVKSGTINVMDVLKKLEDIVPEQAKKSIIGVQNNLIENKLSNVNLNEEDKTILNNYLNELKTKTEYKDLISEEYIQKIVNNNQDILSSLGNISEDDKTKLIEYGKSILSQGNTNYQDILNGLNSLGISSGAKTIVDDIQSTIANRYSEGGITCLSVVNPICGKDNKDYINVCEAKKVGVDVAYKGVCGSCVAEGKKLTTGAECCPGYMVCPNDTKNICQKSCGESDSDNTICTADWNPVCGDNGKTYSNDCFIKKAGVSIKSRGECVKAIIIQPEVKTEVKKEVKKTTTSIDTATTLTPEQMANPASKFCVDQGDKLEIRKNKNGDEYGVCIFKDNRECEEWKFFAKECGVEYIKK
jgi:putative hemolysin